MNRCKTCKHWDRSPPDLTFEHITRQYPGRENGGFCCSPKIREEDPFEPDVLVYEYQERGTFWTGPEFGCVHHEDAAPPAGENGYRGAEFGELVDDVRKQIAEIKSQNRKPARFLMTEDTYRLIRGASVLNQIIGGTQGEGVTFMDIPAVVDGSLKQPWLIEMEYSQGMVVSGVAFDPISIPAVACGPSRELIVSAKDLQFVRDTLESACRKAEDRHDQDGEYSDYEVMITAEKLIRLIDGKGVDDD